MVKQVKLNEEDCSFVSENCSVCGEEMTDDRYIYVNENDQYICLDCKNRYNISAVRCRELDH